MTQKQLESLCKTWQKRLRIQDWKVDVKLSKGQDMDGANVIGMCTPMTSKREADILIREGGDDGEYEEILIHELLHIVFHPELIGIEDKGMNMYEQGVDVTAKALREAYR